MNILHTISEGLYAYGGLYIQQKKPTIVYAPGRVGSMGLIKNLRNAGVYSFKVESFAIEKRGVTKFVEKNIIEPKRPANIISLVRDPVDIVASYYFSKCLKGWIPEGQKALHAGDIHTLQSVFVDEVLETERLDSLLYWFENEFAPSTGVDVFQYPFDTTEKSGTITTDLYSILILRTDHDDESKAERVRSFLSLSDFTVTRENVRANKDFAEEYKIFKNTLSLPEKYLEKIYTAPYVTHFFSGSEQEELKKKWS